MLFSNYEIDMTVIDILDSQLNCLYLTSTSFWYILLTSYQYPWSTKTLWWLIRISSYIEQVFLRYCCFWNVITMIGLILIYSIFQAIILSLVTENIKRVTGLVFMFSVT